MTVGQGVASQLACVRVTKIRRRDSVVLCCVLTKKAMRAKQTKPSAHARYRLGQVHTTRLENQGWVHKTEVFCCDRLLTVKKKKRPPGIGAS